MHVICNRFSSTFKVFSAVLRIRILMDLPYFGVRILMDLHYFVIRFRSTGSEKLDQDPHQSQKLVLDPQQSQNYGAWRLNITPCRLNLES
jgi:hypothetical protein